MEANRILGHDARFWIFSQESFGARGSIITALHDFIFFKMTSNFIKQDTTATYIIYSTVQRRKRSPDRKWSQM